MKRPAPQFGSTTTVWIQGQVSTVRPMLGLRGKRWSG